MAKQTNLHQVSEDNFLKVLPRAWDSPNHSIQRLN